MNSNSARATMPFLRMGQSPRRVQPWPQVRQPAQQRRPPLSEQRVGVVAPQRLKRLCYRIPRRAGPWPHASGL